MLQRLITAAALVFCVFVRSHGVQPAPQLIEAGAAILLLFGLWTPVAGAIVGVRELWIVFSGGSDLWLSLVLATLGVTLAMIGPGAWSVDALLFGRKQIKSLSH